MDPDAAYQATTFGLFNVAGFNHNAVGFETAAELARFVSESEANQVEVWARFLEKNDMLKELRQRDWAGFARRYNGNRAAGTYGERLQLAFERASAAFTKNPD